MITTSEMVKKKLRISEWTIIACFFLIGIASRFPLIEKFQSHWDGPQYSIGVVRYSLSQQTPAPPGYPLYIGLARIIYFFTNNPYSSILLLSVIGAGFGAAVFYIAGKVVFSRTVGIISALLFLTGSTFYYFGLTAYAYGITPTLTTLFAVVAFLIIFKGKNYSLLLSFLFAVETAFRPQEAIFIIPLFLLALRYMPWRDRLISFFSAIFFLLIFFVPYFSFIGFQNYIKVSWQFSHNGSLPGISLFRSFETTGLLRIIQGLFLSFGIGCFALLYYPYRLCKNGLGAMRNKYVLFFGFWILPCFGFNFFIRSDHAGYQMSYLSALIVLISYAIWKLFNKNKRILHGVIAIILIFNLFWFFRNRDAQYLKPYIPTSFHYSEIRKNDLRFGSKIKFIMNNFSPKSTLVISGSTMWRPLTYYFKNYQVWGVDALTARMNNTNTVIRKGYHWNIKEVHARNYSFIVPSEITHIIITDDELPYLSTNLPRKDYKLKANGMVIVLDVKPFDTLSYGYGYINKK